MNSAIVLAAGMALAAFGNGDAPYGEAQSSEVVIPRCSVALIDEAQVPAQEAGVIREILVREGDQVQEGDLVAQIDDTRAHMQKRVAELELSVAHEKAEIDVDIRFAEAAARVAEAEYRQRDSANERYPGTATEAELRTLWLQYRRYVLSIEQAQMARRIASLEAQVKSAEVEASDDNLRRRRIEAPFDGIVVQRHRHESEWVQPGEPVIHLIRMDRLRVSGRLRVQEYTPQEIGGRRVTVSVSLPRGQREDFAGSIYHVDPRVVGGDSYQVWAEIENRTVGGHWLLRPGHEVMMTIHLDQ